MNRHQRRAEEARSYAAHKRLSPQEKYDAWRRELSPETIATFQRMHDDGEGRVHFDAPPVGHQGTCIICNAQGLHDSTTPPTHVYPSNASPGAKPLFCNCPNDPRNTETT